MSSEFYENYDEPIAEYILDESGYLARVYLDREGNEYTIVTDNDGGEVTLEEHVNREYHAEYESNPDR